MNSLFIVGCIFSGITLLLGIIFLTVGIVVTKKIKNKEINCTSKTVGKVIDIVKRRYGSGMDNYDYSYSWHPVFEYKIGELTYTKESVYGNSQPKYAVGQDVEIYYNPENHNEFYVGGDKTSKTLGTIFTIVGITLIVIAVCIFLMFRFL